MSSRLGGFGAAQGGWKALIHPLKLALVQCSSLNLLHHLGQNTLPLEPQFLHLYKNTLYERSCEALCSPQSSWGGLPSSCAQGPQCSFSQEDFLTSILPSLTEIDTVVFIFTLDGEREDGSSGVSRQRQWSDSRKLSFFWVLRHLL